MPSFTVSTELHSPAHKVWEALKDAPVIIPKIAPHVVSSIEHVDGPAEGVGCVKLTKFVNPPGAFVKEKLIAIDPAALTGTLEEIEGGHLAQGFSKWVSTFKFHPISDTTSKWESVVEYEGGNDAVIATSKEKIPKLVIGVSEYINKQ